MLIRVFVDTSVLFSALHSEQGYAYDLLRASLAGRVMLILSEDVLDEVERNLSRKQPAHLMLFRRLLRVLTWLPGIEPTPDDVRTVAQYVVAKDAPIIAAAIRSEVDYVVTYDRKHLLDKPEVAARSGLQIVTPDIVIAELGADSK